MICKKKWKNQGVVALHLQVVLPNVNTLSLYQMCTFSKKQIKSKYLVYSEVVLDGVMVHQFGKRCICGMQWVDLAHRRQPLIKFLILFQRKSDYNLENNRKPNTRHELNLAFSWNIFEDTYFLETRLKEVVCSYLLLFHFWTIYKLIYSSSICSLTISIALLQKLEYKLLNPSRFEIINSNKT